MINFESIIKMTQKELFNALRREYSSETTVFQSGSFILVRGEAPIMLVAHLDTVHTNPVSTICKSADGIWMAPEGIGGDDRCGVFCLMTVHEKAAVKPWLLFTCDEEKGGVGAHGFVSNIIDKQNKITDELKALKYIVEIDRQGKNDAVYYSCGNNDFEAYITSKGFKTQYGSYSDISTIAPELGVAAVNLSSGYYHAHTQHEYINVNHLKKTTERVIELVNESVSDKVPAYEYVEAYYRNSYYSGWHGGWEDKAEQESWDLAKQNLSGSGIQMYNELLDIYFPSELNELIAADGERGLEELYESEYPESSDVKKKSGKYKDIPANSLPSNLHRMYQDLLEYYTPQCLHNYRCRFGDEIIKELHESIFGKTQLVNYSR